MILSNATLFPQALLPLHIFERRYRQMLADALQADRLFAVAMQKPGRARGTPCDVAGLGVIRVSVDHHDGTSHLILQGLTRLRLLDAVQYRPYRVHAVEVLPTPATNSVTLDALSVKTLELVCQRLELGPSPFRLPISGCQSSSEAKGEENPGPKFSVKDVLKYLEHLPNTEQLADLVACALLPNSRERQTILETVELEQRMRRLIHFLMAEIQRQQDNIIS